MEVYYKLISQKEPVQPLPGVRVTEEKKDLYQILIWIVIGAGIALRLYHYFDNRSLWVDEIYLSTSIIKMSYLELATATLDYQQKAPITFLWLVRLSVELFGTGEKALRLVPLLCGVGSLLLFAKIARNYLSPLGVVLALSIMAFAPPIVYHSVEIKQYSADLFAAVLSFYLYIRYEGNLQYRALLMWGIFGSLLLWFSFPVIFILAGIAIGVSLYYLINKKWKALFRSIIPFSMWLVSFATNYFLFTHKHAEADWLVDWFRNRQGFMPQDASFLGGIVWVLKSLYRLIDYPVGVLWNSTVFDSIDSTAVRVLLKLTPLLIFFLGLGVYYISKQNKKLLLALLFPIILTLVAGLLDKYPFYERLVLFLAPIPILFLAHGCARLTNILSHKSKLSYIFPLILLGWPVWSSAKQAVDTELFWDYKYSKYRGALLYIDQHMQEGDVLYIYWNAKPAYRFYSTTYKLDLDGRELTDARFLVRDEHEYVERLRAEYGKTEGVKRIWFLYEPFLMLEIGDYDRTPPWYHQEGIKAGTFIKNDLSTIGEEIDRYTSQNVGVSLYKVYPKN